MKIFLNETISVVNGLFLLFLAIVGNFVAETLGCQTQELLTNNIFVKQIMTFFILYFTIDYSDSSHEHPIKNLTKALLIYIFFLLFTKMGLTATIITFVLLFSIYLSNSYKKYYETTFKNKKNKTKEDMKEYEKQMNNIHRIQNIMIWSVLIVVLVGFLLYYREKSIEYSNSFDFMKFIFGVVNCKGLN